MSNSKTKKNKEAGGGLQSPFPWSGGKRLAASLIWSRLGNVNKYIEPFAGSLAVLLKRPHAPRHETVNDKDCYIANFWRAVKEAPDEVAHYADNPSNEADYHAWHKWLREIKEFRESMMSNPRFHNVAIAGRWLWGIKITLGPMWCRLDKKQSRSKTLTTRGVNSKTLELIEKICERLRNVRVLCGDWSRAITPIEVSKVSPAGVFLDSPYDSKILGIHDCYSEDEQGLSTKVREWAIANGENPKLRIALCGFEAEHKMPKGWTKVAWTNNGGWNNHKCKENRFKERIWFSPYCLKDGFAT